MATPATTLREAKGILEIELYKLNRAATMGESADNNYLIRDLLDDWIEHITILTPNPKTCRDYLRNAERAVKGLEAIQITNAIDINLKAITQLQNALLESKVSHNTINKSRIKLKAILEYGLDNKLIVNNPLKKVTILPLQRVKYRRAYKEEEVFKLLKLAQDIWRPFYHFALSTGCRIAEIINLRWEDIDQVNSQIHITSRLDWQPKTTSGERTIPITEKLQGTLSILTRHSSYVFATSDGLKLENNVLRELKKVMKKVLAELNPNWDKERISEELKLLDFHVLWYTFYTKLIKNGVDIKTVQRIMGHADVKTTLGIYAQYVHGGMENAVENIKW